MSRGLVRTWRNALPLPADAEAVSLGEGATPLVRLYNLPRSVGFRGEWYVKFEGLNPTGSFKDRGMTVAVTQALAEGSRAVLCASTGNTSASAAAYAARAGLKAFVLIPEGKIAGGKLAQAVMHGAEILQIRGNFDDGMRLVRQLAQTLPLSLVNSVNPYRLQGQKTAAFEILESLGDAPDVHCLPVGNAGNISAYWLGYSEAAGQKTAVQARCEGAPAYRPPSLASRRPVMAGYQASGAAPFVHGGPVQDPDTVATAIRIGAPQSWDLARSASEESGGWFHALDDAEILAAQKRLARTEGIFCEPASAASVAGALHDIGAGRIAADARIVCTLTGHGLKDPDVALAQGRADLRTVDAELGAVRDALEARLA